MWSLPVLRRRRSMRRQKREEEREKKANVVYKIHDSTFWCQWIYVQRKEVYVCPSEFWRKGRKEDARERKNIERTLLDGCWTDDLYVFVHMLRMYVYVRVCVYVFVCTIFLPGGLLHYLWKMMASDDFSPLLFPFVRPLVTDSNLSFDANNIWSIGSCLRRKKRIRRRRRISEWRKGQYEEGYERTQKMDIVHTHTRTHIYVYPYGNALYLAIDKRKENKIEECHGYV